MTMITNLNEKINAIKNKERYRLLLKLEDAKGNYRDTGKDRYFKQITRLEEQISAIDGMTEATVAQVNNVKATHRKHIMDIKRRAEEFAKEEPLNIEFKHFCKWLDNYIDVIERECY